MKKYKWKSINFEIERKVYDQVCDQVWYQVRDQVWNKVRGQVKEKINEEEV